MQRAMTPDRDEPGTALIVGDMHGNLHAWEYRVLPDIERHEPSVIIQIGDFGYGWSSDYGHGWDDAYLNGLDAFLYEIDANVFWIDGNHENFDKLETVGAFGSTVPFQTSERTWYIPRGTAWEWAGIRCLGVGGAYSVDKPWRKAHVSWWEQEELTDEDVARAIAVGPVDIMFAHDTFTGIRVPGIHAEWKQDEYEEVCKPNRDRLLEIVNAVDPSIYVHGHYHYGYQLITGEMKLFGLDRESAPASRMLISYPALGTWVL